MSWMAHKEDRNQIRPVWWNPRCPFSAFNIRCWTFDVRWSFSAKKDTSVCSGFKKPSPFTIWAILILKGAVRAIVLQHLAIPRKSVQIAHFFAIKKRAALYSPFNLTLCHTLSIYSENMLSVLCELSALRADLENFGHRFHGLHRFLFHKCGGIYEMEVLFEQYRPNP